MAQEAGQILGLLFPLPLLLLLLLLCVVVKIPSTESWNLARQLQFTIYDSVSYSLFQRIYLRKCRHENGGKLSINYWILKIQIYTNIVWLYLKDSMCDPQNKMRILKTTHIHLLIGHCILDNAKTTPISPTFSWSSSIFRVTSSRLCKKTNWLFCWLPSSRWSATYAQSADRLSSLLQNNNDDDVDDSNNNNNNKWKTK